MKNYFKKYFAIILNNIFFFINIHFMVKKNKYYKYNKIKNIDKALLALATKSLKNISNYLNSKFYSNKVNNKYFNNKNKEKIILIDCVDFLKNNKYCINNLNGLFKNKKYKFKLDINNPDYILYDVFGCEHNKKKYEKSIKIACFSENIIPDFNEADYALSQAHFTYLDRYFKYPSFIWRLNKLRNFNISKIRKGVLRNSNRTKFCAAVISNNKSYSNFRLNFIKYLNKYKTVDMGGKALNNIGGNISNKIEFLSSYKFSIAMENSEGDGYISEKIIESFLAGTIPIYYGDYMIDEYINPKAYILIKGKKDIMDKIEFIKKIDSNDTLYKSILNENIFLYNDIQKKAKEEYKFFFYNIFEQEKNLSKRIEDNNKNLKCKIKERG